jgi:hypothetical protein
MRKFIFLFIVAGIAVFFQSCRSIKVSEYAVDNAPISPKLPALEKSFNNNNNTHVNGYSGIALNSSHSMQILNDEFDDNICNPYGAKYGYVLVSTSYIKSRAGLGFALISGYTLLLPNLLGFPMGRYYYEMQVTVEILNSKRELIGKYRAIGKGKAMVAYYYGYGSVSASTKANLDALKGALRDIRTQIQQDASRLNNDLQTAGPNNINR